MQIYSAGVDDARRIAQIHVLTWQAAYAGVVPDGYLAALSVDQREAYWRQEISLGVQKIAIARLDDVVCGWVSYGPSRDGDSLPRTAEIWAIYVAPEYWSSGVGRQLWLHAQAHLTQEGFQSVSFWGLAVNKRAIDFYARAGLVPDHVSAREFALGGVTLREIRYKKELTKAS